MEMRCFCAQAQKQVNKCEQKSCEQKQNVSIGVQTVIAKPTFFTKFPTRSVYGFGWNRGGGGSGRRQEIEYFKFKFLKV